MPIYTPNMGSREYWIERALDRDLFSRKTEDEIIREINSLYSQSFREIKNELNT